MYDSAKFSQKQNTITFCSYRKTMLVITPRSPVRMCACHMREIPAYGNEVSIRSIGSDFTE